MRNSFLIRSALVAILLMAGSLGVYAQSRVSGVVTEVRDGKKTPLAGVSIVVKGTSIGTMSSADGAFTLSIPASSVKPTMVFSFLGYKSQDISVGSQSTINVNMAEDATMLENLVVVGYGTMKRSDVTGAVASVNTEEMKAYPTTSVAEMLRGRAAGVTVTTTSGRPGSAPSIEIRGKRSLNADNIPLYIVDGAPVTGTEFATINGADIESIEVLKDAASQAIYGARAANGVILVTTKRGKSGRASISINSSVSIQDLWRNFDFYSPEEWYGLRREAMANDGIYNIADMTPESVLADAIYMKNYNEKNFTDWESLMLKPAIMQKHDVSITGGTDKMRVAVGLGYLDQKGMVTTGSGYKRGNIRINLDYDATNWLTVGFNTAFTKGFQENEEGTFNSYITLSPLGSPYNDKGELLEDIDLSGTKNPIYAAKNAKNDVSFDIFRINGYFDFKILNGLKYRFQMSYYNRFAEDGAYKTATYPKGGAAGSISNSKSQNYVIDNILTYEAPIKHRDHRLSLTAVQSYDRTISRTTGFGANTVPVDSFWWDMIADGVNASMSRSVNENILISFVGRASYAYKDRYLLTAAFRHDGSSRFGKNNRWASFPSVAVGWRLSEEPFMAKTKDFIDNIKIRASYGVVGNQNGIGNYTTLGNTVDYKYEFGDIFQMGYLPGNSLSNPYLKWEETASANLGIDFGFFNNRVSGSIEVYNTDTKNLLCTRTLVGAYTSMMDNLGKTRTQGLEVTLNTTPIRSKSVTWDVGLNFATNKNKIIKIDDRLNENGQPADNVKENWFIGQPIDVYYTLKSNGIWQYNDFDLIDGGWVVKPTFDSDGDGVADTRVDYGYPLSPGMVKIVDKNNDGKISVADDKYIRRKDPKFVMSVNTSIQYKGFDLFMDWYGVYGRLMQNKYLHDPNSGGSLQGKQQGIKVNYWTPNNPSNDFPRPSFNTNPTNLNILAFQDASYLRLRTLSLGYTFPNKMMKSVHIQNLRIYATASNLLTFTKYLSYSPEVAPGTYPEARQYVFGINLSF